MHQAITFSITKGNKTWFVSAVYASPIFSMRCVLWQHLKNLRSRINNNPWVLLGDLNEVVQSNEVSGGTFSHSRAQLMSSMMEDCNFMDLYTTGGFFTWRKNVQNAIHVRKRLDRCMGDVSWRVRFPNALVEVLTPHNSDHNPLLLSCSKAPSVKSKCFHFQASWISHPEYGGLVQRTWNSTNGDATLKLNKIKDCSLLFNKHVFGNIFRRKRKIEGRLRGVHQQLDIFPFSTLIQLEKDLQQELSSILAQEELLWYQKSRENWVRFGNRNTKFFHTQTIIRRRRNRITGLDLNGVWCTDDQILKQEADSFFKNLFLSNDYCDPHSLHLQHVPRIGEGLVNSLLQAVTPLEVKEALFSMHAYKAPGIDGFQPIFFKTYWNTVGSDVHALVANSFASNSIPEHLATTLIVPIPKVDVPMTLKDFRPISLCNVLLKVISN